MLCEFLIGTGAVARVQRRGEGAQIHLKAEWGGIEEKYNSVRRRCVALARDHSTRPQWLDPGYQSVNQHGNVVISEAYRHAAGTIALGMDEFRALAISDRCRVGCASVCGFRVNVSPEFGGYCCCNCAVWTARVARGFACKGLQQHGLRCASTGVAFEEALGDEIGLQPWASGDEAHPGEAYAPPLPPSSQVMSELAQANWCTENLADAKKKAKKKTKTKQSCSYVCDYDGSGQGRDGSDWDKHGGSGSSASWMST